MPMGGGMNQMQMMKQAQKMQQDLSEDAGGDGRRRNMRPRQAAAWLRPVVNGKHELVAR